MELSELRSQLERQRMAGESEAISLKQKICRCQVTLKVHTRLKRNRCPSSPDDGAWMLCQGEPALRPSSLISSLSPSSIFI